MISAGDFRNGVTFEEDGNVLQVVEFQHVKPGKGAAFVRTKVKNVITGSVVEKAITPPQSFPLHLLRERIWNTPTTTAIFITIWTLRPTSRLLSAPLSFPTTSSSSRSR